uniref:Uncharacterized protein n=1 Tax=Romanomermis culicivorax TaxID=13658 RepID=A0A915IE83_ROMCU
MFFLDGIASYLSDAVVFGDQWLEQEEFLINGIIHQLKDIRFLQPAKNKTKKRKADFEFISITETPGRSNIPYEVA